jgi:phosphodiesterase/alkaline phosphatase D-like protein
VEKEQEENEEGAITRKYLVKACAVDSRSAKSGCGVWMGQQRNAARARSRVGCVVEQASARNVVLLAGAIAGTWPHNILLYL